MCSVVSVKGWTLFKDTLSGGHSFCNLAVSALWFIFAGLPNLIPQESPDKSAGGSVKVASELKSGSVMDILGKPKEPASKSSNDGKHCVVILD